MTPELIEMLVTAIVPIIGALGLYLAKQFLNLRGMEMTAEAEEVARLRITAAVERVAGAIRAGDIMNIADAVEYIEDRFEESLATLGMPLESTVNMITVEIARQSSPVVMQ